MTYWPGHPPPTPPRPPWYRNPLVWLWTYVGVAVLGIIAVAALVLNGLDFGTFDDDGYYYVDQESVNRAVAQACSEMSEAGQDIKVFVTPAEGAEALRRFVTTARGVPAAIDAVDDADSAARHWRDDWVAVLDALDTYADELESDPTARFTGPDDEYGQSSMYALSYASDVECELPAAVQALDPEAAGSY